MILTQATNLSDLIIELCVNVLYFFRWCRNIICTKTLIPEWAIIKQSWVRDDMESAWLTFWLNNHSFKTFNWLIFKKVLKWKRFTLVFWVQ